MQTRTLSDKYRKYVKGPLLLDVRTFDALTGHQSSAGHSVSRQSDIENDQELLSEID